MHTGFSIKAAALSAAVAGIAALTPPAGAAIICNGNFQVVGASEISTPYCRDTHLARLARRSGFNVSDGAILYNPNTKREVCRYLNTDIEAQSACADTDGRGGTRH